MRAWRTSSVAWLGLVAGFAALGLQACGGGGGGGAASGQGATGRVAVLLTDGPVHGFDEVNVTITRIELLSDSGRVSIFSSPEGEVRNLLSLEDDAELFAVHAEVPAGRYDKIRLTVSDVELVRPDGMGGVETFHPKLPGNGKIDLNPRHPFFVVPGETLIVQLDMDARKSIHIVETKGKMSVKFRPVVFVDVLQEVTTGKLVRIRGLVEQKDEAGFLLCPAGVNAADFADYDRFLQACVDVRVSEETSFFGEDGSPASFEGLSVADEVEAIGRFRMGTMEGAGDHLAVFDAFVVEVGGAGAFLKLKGTVRSEPAATSPESEFPQIFAFELDPGQGFSGDLVLDVLLEERTRIFSVSGEPLDPSVLRAGQRVTVDGVVSLPEDLVKAALVMVDAASPEQGDLEGVIAEVTETVGERRLDLEGGECATVPEGAHLFRMEQVTPTGPVSIVPISFGDLAVGQTVRLFGTPIEGGCFETEVGFVLHLSE